ncbi:hypothetical protein B566_EDAN018762, partial [Ephemera danica]
MVGAQNSIVVGVIAVGIGVGAGVAFGLLAAARRGWVEELVMRAADFTFAFPALLTAIMLTAIYGPGLVTSIVAIGIFNVPVFAREYVLAARVAGKGGWRITVDHVLPNIASVLIVQATIQFATAILAEAALMRQLHDDVQRPQAHVVGELRADAEAQLRAVTEMAVKVQGLVDAQAVAEHQALGVRVDAQPGVMRQRLFAPGNGVAAVVAQAVEELGEVQIEVGQEGVHAHHIGQCDAEVPAVFLYPGLQCGALEIAQPHARGLKRLQVFMRHGADGHQVQIARHQHIAGALEVLRHLQLQGADHLALPGARKTPAHAEIKELERVLARWLALKFQQHGDLRLQPFAPAGNGRSVVEAAEIEFVDGGQHEDLEGHHMHLRP